MKDALLIAIVCMAWSAALTYTATAESATNEKLKWCLDTNGYTPEKFDTFDFGKSAACFHDWKSKQTAYEIAKLRKFLKENPWYKGRDWQWEACAKDNTCTKRYAWWSTKEN